MNARQCADTRTHTFTNCGGIFSTWLNFPISSAPVVFKVCETYTTSDIVYCYFKCKRYFPGFLCGPKVGTD